LGPQKINSSGRFESRFCPRAVISRGVSGTDRTAWDLVGPHEPARDLGERFGDHEPAAQDVEVSAAQGDRLAPAEPADSEHGDQRRIGL
jgi:hypothetical protein